MSRNGKIFVPRQGEFHKSGRRCPAESRLPEYLQSKDSEVRVALRNDIRKYETEYGAQSSYVSPPPT
jgi:hypothetical protein